MSLLFPGNEELRCDKVERGAHYEYMEVYKLTTNHVLTVTEKILARNPEHELRRAFELFDDDRTGKISLKNLRRVARELGETLGEEELCVSSLKTPQIDLRWEGNCSLIIEN